MSYEYGNGVPQNYEKAVKWYRKAADQGDTAAQNNLGMMYRSGQGVPQDYVRAFMWFSLAASSSGGEDNERAIENRNIVAAKMTPAQIEQAEGMTKHCKQSNFKDCD